MLAWIEGVPAALKAGVLALLLTAVVGLGLWGRYEAGQAEQARLAIATYQARVAAEAARQALAAEQRASSTTVAAVIGQGEERTARAVTVARIEEQIAHAQPEPLPLPPPQPAGGAQQLPSAPGPPVAACGPASARPAVAAALRGLQQLTPAAAGGGGAAGGAP